MIYDIVVSVILSFLLIVFCSSKSINGVANLMCQHSLKFFVSKTNLIPYLPIEKHNIRINSERIL